MKQDKDYVLYKARSREFEYEVKNQLNMAIPHLDPDIADYLAKRLDLIRLVYEKELMKRFEKNVD